MKKIIAACVLCVSIFCFSSAPSANLLSGSVSYDTGMYTYSYTLNNSSGGNSIQEFSVIIDSVTQGNTPIPTSSTGPTNWTFYVGPTNGGSIERSPYNMAGTMYFWWGSNALAAHAENAITFSFTTNRAPTAGSSNNYFLWSPDGSAVVEYGHIVAPDFGVVATVPVPAAVWLLGTGLITIVGIRKKYAR